MTRATLPSRREVDGAADDIVRLLLEALQSPSVGLRVKGVLEAAVQVLTLLNPHDENHSFIPSQRWGTRVVGGSMHLEKAAFWLPL